MHVSWTISGIASKHGLYNSQRNEYPSYCPMIPPISIHHDASQQSFDKTHMYQKLPNIKKWMVLLRQIHALPVMQYHAVLLKTRMAQTLSKSGLNNIKDGLQLGSTIGCKVVVSVFICFDYIVWNEDLQQHCWLNNFPRWKEEDIKHFEEYAPLSRIRQRIATKT